MTLLRLLGVPYVESAGEAEALCAWMNAQGIVDGCITNDGDAFLYGARNVYKDLCVSSKECMMDSYCMDDIETKLCLNREKLVSLAILLGCDYLPQGVPGVGKEMGLKLVQALQGVNLLQRLQDWKGFKGGEDGLSKIEKTVKLKASKVAGFPSQAVINEFMCPELKTQHLTVPKGYRCPDLKGLQEFCLNYLEWPEDYTTEKVFPLMTYWQMEAGMSVKHCIRESIVTPERIVKARVQNRIECYEILWKSKDIGDACQSTFVTIETRSLFGQVYPILVEEFEILQNEKKKKKKGKRKAKHDNAEDLANGNSDALEELCSELQTLSLAAERVSLRETTSQTKLSDGKQAASSEYEMAETEWEKKQEGSSLDDENMKQEEEQVHGEDDEQQHSIGVKYLQRNILDSNETKERKSRKGKNGLKSEEDVVHDVKKRQKRQELQQRCELDDKQQHSDGTKYVQTGKLVPDDENGKKVLKKKKNLEVKDSKVEDPLDTVTSSEDELSDSLLCEFVAPLAQRLERQWPNDSKNERTVDHNPRGDFPDLVHSADSKSANKCNVVDNGIQVVLIDSSEDETEQDEIHGSRGQENSRQKPHIMEKSEGSSSRKYDGQTTRYLESDVKMKSLGREEMCARTEHKIHIALTKTEDEGTLNGKEIRKEAVFIPLVNEAVSSNAGYRDKMATDKMKNDVEISETKKPGNHCHERFPSSYPRQSGLPVKDFDLTAVSLSHDDRASATASSHRGIKIRSDRKPKVMQRVYFSSDDDDDSWFIGSGNAAAAGTPVDKHRDSNADDYWYIGTTNDDGGSATAAATSAADGNGAGAGATVTSGAGGNGATVTSSTPEQDIFSVVDRSEKVSTPKLLEKTEGKENVESPLDDVFVPLSLSERLGRNLSGRRNVLNTLRTLSSN